MSLPFRHVVDKLPDIMAVNAEIKRQYVGIRQAQRQHSPELRHQCVIAIAGIPKMIHPVKIVVHRVVDAIGAVEAKPMTGSPTKLRKTVWSEPLPMRVLARLASVTAWVLSFLPLEL